MEVIKDLREIQLLEVDILRHLETVCKKDKIRFFLSNGTLLGAIKYQKFIPWDDDIDVFVPRKDYDRLMQSKEIDDGPYRLFAMERQKEWFIPYAKLCDERTVVNEGSANVGCEHGVAVDIFPLDYWWGNKRQAEYHAFYCGLLRRFLAASLENTFVTPKKGVAKFILYCIWKYSRLMGYDYFLKKLKKEIGRVEEKDACFCGSVAWSLYGRKEVHRKEIFEEDKMVVFEEAVYRIPVGYDEYLRKLYGDYEEDPPLEKQKPHHQMKVWKK